MAQNDDLSSSNKNTDEIINKIQTSLERLQTTINLFKIKIYYNKIKKVSTIGK